MSLDYATETVAFDVAEGIATITLNRPHEGNAITREMSQGLQAAWVEVKRNPDIRVAIISGAGERHFCTGAAASSIKSGDDGAGLDNGTLKDVVRLSPHAHELWKPVICAVNGLVNGGGLHLVVDADIVVAAQSSSFMDTHVNMGQVGALENIGVARRMTLGSALLMTLVGRDYRMTAERAHQLGLVDLIEPTAAEALETARRLAASIARNSPQAVSLSKQALWASQDLGYKQAQELGWQLIKQQWHHPDFDEGPRAFMERRAPDWNPDPNARR